MSVELGLPIRSPKTTPRFRGDGTAIFAIKYWFRLGKSEDIVAYGQRVILIIATPTRHISVSEGANPLRRNDKKRVKFKNIFR